MVTNEQKPRPPVTVDTYPSIPLAYEYVMPTYEWAIQRSDKTEDRLQAAILAISGMTLAMPTLGVTLIEERGPMSVWFAGAIVTYFVAMWIGLPAQAGALVRIVNPQILHDKWLHKTPEVFKVHMLSNAAEDLRDSMKLINARYDALFLLYKAASVEVVFWILWIVLG